MTDVFRGELKVSTLYLQDPNAWWRTWTWQFNPNLLPKLPPGKQYWELSPRIPDYPFPVSLRTWNDWYPLMLIGRDRVLAGKQSYARPEPGPIQPDRTWTQNLLQSTLAPPAGPAGKQSTALVVTSADLGFRGWIFSLLPLGQPAAPVGEQIYDLAPRSEDPFPRALRAWSWSYNLNLIGQDFLPIGTVIDRIPRAWAYQYPTDVYKWSWKYIPELVGQDALPTGDRIYELPPRDPREARAWAWWYNLSLIGQDARIAGEQVFTTPPAVTWYQTWVLNLLTSTLSVVGLPVGEQVYDRPQLPQSPLVPSWTWTYNLNLIGQDQLPVGEVRTALVVPAAAPIDATWTWKYLLELIGRDALPSGEVVYDLPPREAREVRGWNVNLVLTTLLGQDRMVVGRQVYDPTPRGLPPIVPSWAWQYNLNLIGQDALPVGDRSFELPQRLSWYQSWTQSLLTSTLFTQAIPPGQQRYDTPPPVTWQRSWVQNLLQSTLFAPQLPTGEQVYALPVPSAAPIMQSWTWQYNPNLVGQDALPVGRRATDLPSPVDWRIGWAQNLLASTLAPVFALPFNQYDWPIPKGPIQPVRGWTWAYNLDLIGQDSMLIGRQVWDLTPFAPPRKDQTWVWQYNLNLIGQDALPVGQRSFDQPPLRVFWQRSWEVNLVLSTLRGQDRLPTGEQIWALAPQPPVPSALVWTWQYNPNLIGQDALPVGQRSWARPPEVDWRQGWTQSLVAQLTAAAAVPFFPNAWQLPDQGFYQTDLRTWVQATKLLLAVPFNQLDWPVPRAPQQPALGWTASYNLNLIAQDKLVVGKQVYDRPTLDVIQPDRSYTSSGLSLLTAPIVYTVGAQVYDLTPRGYEYPVDLRNSIFGVNINLYPPPPPPVVIVTQIVGDPYDRRKRYRFSQPFAPMDRWQYEEMLHFIERSKMNAAERRAYDAHWRYIRSVSDERDIEFLMLDGVL